MQVARTTTYVEMTAPAQLRPAQDVEGLLLRCLADPAYAERGRIRALHDRIAQPHHWSSLTWSDQRWATTLSQPRQRVWAVTHQGDEVGLGWLGHEPRAGVEIVMFGLVPEAVGRGLGGAALTSLVREAWAWLAEAAEEPSGDEPSIPRVWLHTSSLDHPNALANYLSRGFTVFAERHDTKTLPLR